MSLDLHDVRGKVKRETKCALVAYRIANDFESESEVIREIVEAWGDKQIHASTVLQRCLRSEGGVGAIEVISGQPGAVVLDFDK